MRNLSDFQIQPGAHSAGILGSCDRTSYFCGDEQSHFLAFMKQQCERYAPRLSMLRTRSCMSFDRLPIEFITMVASSSNSGSSEMNAGILWTNFFFLRDAVSLRFSRYSLRNMCEAS